MFADNRLSITEVVIDKQVSTIELSYLVEVSLVPTGEFLCIVKS